MPPKVRPEIASKVYLAAELDGKSFDPAEFGIEFSTGDIREYLKVNEPPSLLSPSSHPARVPLASASA